MWYVDAILMEDVERDKTKFAPFIRIDHYSMHRYLISMRFKESQTGETAAYRFTPHNWNLCRRFLKKQKPYGLVFTGDTDLVAVVVDNLSMQFLDYIDSVEFLRPGQRVWKLLGGTSECVTYDEHNTIFGIPYTFDGSVDIRTLFQLACNMPKCWDNRVFWVRSLSREAWKVKFTDVSKARGLVVKANALGYNSSPVARSITDTELKEWENGSVSYVVY